jgi:RimJ/RimL family protein N-acetyltransferase
MSDVVVVREGTAADLGWVYDAERQPGYEWLVGQWTRDEHAAAVQRPDTRYLIAAVPGSGPVGFVILQPLADVHEGTKLKRVVVTQPGQGCGPRMLRATFDWVFAHTDSTRLWLDVFTDNERAQRAYRTVGMRQDGLLRQAYRMPDGRRCDRYIMSLLRSEWPVS